MRDERTPKDVCGEASEYHAEQNRCRKLGVLPKFHSKAYLKIHEYPSADDFESKKRLYGVSTA